jgi:hypothetical protein
MSDWKSSSEMEADGSVTAFTGIGQHRAIILHLLRWPRMVYFNR